MRALSFLILLLGGLWLDLAAATFAAGQGRLTIGSPAPPLRLAKFLRGEPVTKLVLGTVYVIGFSGTQCAPCQRSIPHLTALQEKHATVVFLSVYSEPEEKLRPYLEMNRNSIGYRVAIDRDGATQKEWLQAASLLGIPHVFLVGANGNIAWIGSPFDVAEPLERLLAGELDTQVDRVRLLFQQEETESFLEAAARMERASEASERVNALIRKQQWAQAVRAAEQGAREFPEQAFSLNCQKVYALAANPQTIDEGIAFAARLAARARHTWGDSPLPSGAFPVAIAQSLAPREVRDKRLTAAALLLLRQAEADLAQVANADERRDRQIYLCQVYALVYAQQNDRVAAATQLRKALELLRVRTHRPAFDEDREQWETNQRERMRGIEGELAVLEEAGEPAP